MAYSCGKEDFDIFAQNLARNNAIYCIEEKRARKVLIHAGRTMAIHAGGKSSRPQSDFNKSLSERKQDLKQTRQVLALISAVKKDFTSHIIRNKIVIPQVEQIYGSSWQNQSKWIDMPKNSKFWYVDVNHCYWRIAYLLGYISERLYKQTLVKDDMKLYRNMALACVVAGKARKYFRGSEKIMEFHESTDLYVRMYDNIRYTAYNIMGRIAEATRDKCLGYKVDGIMVDSEYLEVVKTMLDEENLFYKVKDCQKINGQMHTLGDDVRKF